MSPSSRALIVAPTGSGKSCILAEICRRVITAKPDYKILVLAHRKELVCQNAMEISNMIGQPVGLYSAGLRSKQIRSITSAGIQSIYNKSPQANLVIIDECHLFSGEDTSMYGKLLSRLPNAKVVGLTATCYRTDQGGLVGDGAFFTDIAYDIGVRELIDDGYLCPLISKPTQTVDMTGVSRSGWDYNQEEAAEKFLPSVLEHCKSLLAHTDRKHWLIFATGVKHAHMVAECLCSLGVAAAAIDGNMLAIERDQIIGQFKSGKLQALVNCEILTTGFNFPAIDLIVLLRATKSTGLYVQIVGRGMRIAPGKDNACLVLDFGGNITRHGPIDAIEVKRKPKGGVTIGCAPIKECPKCGAVSVVRTLVCSCGYEFPLQTNTTIVASTAPILSQTETLDVLGVDVRVHKKQRSSLRIEFRCGLRWVSDYLCFDHGFYPANQARQRWYMYAGTNPPKTTAEAYNRLKEIRVPCTIEVRREGKFDKVTGVNFNDNSEIAGDRG